ncbi:MAG: hypothetical protein D6B28_08900 [Gammaproteobacteria bacterium]|mgnify:CR=1 FL=1|nr:MAG: hypothetical protein D6B28_08900 [Gammaproteobacteria bacterium]
MTEQLNNKTYCDISWKNDTTPISNEYGDVYFSADNGLLESKYVFIESNSLSSRFSTADDFHIAEAGFGTGLNFAIACKLWNSISPSDTTLFFTSFEKHPLAFADFRKAANNWKELESVYSHLLPTYSNLKPGNNIFDIPLLRTVLNIIVGDINDMIPSIPSSSIDCWFLDGFAPSVNPQMWTETVISNVTKSAKPESTLSTFTAAGNIRRALIKHGYKVSKKPGFGKKREMIFGIYHGS